LVFGDDSSCLLQVVLEELVRQVKVELQLNLLEELPAG
jgi:hypothetical protein